MQQDVHCNIICNSNINVVDYISHEHQQMHTHILNHHFLNTIHNYNMFQPLKVIFREYSWYILVVGPCHHGMACLQVVDGGMMSNTDGSCEYIEQAVAGSRQGVVL
jgi:hypothetical protein